MEAWLFKDSLNRAFKYFLHYGSPFLIMILVFSSLWVVKVLYERPNPDRLICNTEYFLDHSGKVRIENIQSVENWSIIDGCNGSLGYVTEPVWIRIKIWSSEKDRLIELLDTTQDYINYYRPVGENEYEIVSTGDLRPLESREFPFRTFVFSTGNADRYHYIRLETNTGGVRFPLRITFQDRLIRSEMFREIIMGMLYGALLILSAYNLVLFFSLRDSSYIHFLLFLFGIVTYLASQSGFIAYHIFSENAIFNQYTSGSGSAIGQIGSLSFTLSYLNAKKNAPVAYRLSYILFALIGLFFLVDLLRPDLTGYPSIILPAFILGLVFWTVGATYRKNRERTIEYLIVSSVFLISLPFHLIYISGVSTESTVNLFSLETGLVAASVFLTLTISRRINQIRNEQVRSQQEAIANNEKSLESLRQLDQLKDRFLAATSHELRTPLQGIIGLGQVIQEMEQGKLKSESRENLQHIINSARYLNLLINDILDYSAMKAGAIRLRRELVDPEAILASLAKLNSLYASSRGVGITIKFSPEQKVLSVDPIRIEQIFQNILHNAIKYTHSGGTVQVETRSEDSSFEVRITDQGDGIPEEYKNLIFEEFFQIPEDAQNQASGTGLGLSITRSLVDLHHGTIKIESVPKSGSSFVIRFPISEQPATSSQVTAKYTTTRSEDKTRSLSVFPSRSDQPLAIIVEDHPYTSRVIQHVVGERGYRTEVFVEGNPALERILEGSPDLVILDIMLPDTNGIQILKKIREKKSLRDLPVLILTAMQKHEDMVQGMNAGANDFLNKPFETDELRQRIQIIHNWKELEVTLDQEQESYTSDLEHKIKNIYADLHDHLGARLTDMKMMIHKMEKAKDIDSELLVILKENLNRTIQLLRNRLNDLEDHRMISENFFDGIQFSTLRRYLSIERTIQFKVTEDAKLAVMKPEFAFLRKELFSIITEIITNDIKYGEDRATFIAELIDNQLVCHFHSGSRFKPRDKKDGNGSSFLQFRVNRLGGSIQMQREANRFSIELFIPLHTMNLQATGRH